MHTARLLLWILILGAAAAFGEEPMRHLISDFQNADEIKKVSTGDSGAVEMSIAPRSATDNNNMLKVVFRSGQWPGFNFQNVPKDWSAYEALSFIVWIDSPFELQIRIDDAHSTDYKSRFNKSVKLEKGRNLVQLKVKEEIGRVLKSNEIRSLILFTSNPPPGLTLWFDDVQLGPLQSEEVPFIPYAERADLQPKMDFETPHFQFARNLNGGPLSAFLLTGITGGREVVELMQRIDLKARVMHWDSAWDINTWGMGDFYGARGHAFDRVLMQKYFASSMQGPEKFEVLLLNTPYGWREFPKGAREALIKRVKENGEGLVLVQPWPGEKTWPDDLKELSALIDSDTDQIDAVSGYVRQASNGRISGKSWAAVGGHPITRGIPFDAMPFDKMTYQQYKLAPGATAIVQTETGDPIIAVKQLGKGRVVSCAWRGTPLAPAVWRGDGEGPARPYRHWEALYSLLARCAAWAGGRELSHEGDAVALETKYPDSNLTPFVWRDKDHKVSDWELRYVAPGADGIQVIEIHSPGNAVDPKAPAIVTRGEPLSISFTPPDKPVGIDWEVVLGERSRGAWRTIEVFAQEPAKTMAHFMTAPTDRLRQTLGIVRVLGTINGKIVARGEKEVVVTPHGETWDDYEIFQWPVDGLSYLREWEDVKMIDAGATGVMDTQWNNRERLLRWTRAGLRILPHNLDVRPLHIRPAEFANIAAKYNETKDKKLLIRPNSYADPNFLEAARQKVIAGAKLLKPFHIPAYVLCDEPSLTSYREEFDFDFHAENIKLFRAALEKKFGAIANLNAALGTKYDAFEKIEPPTTAEAKTAGNWGLWNEWRAHNDTVMAEGYRRYRDALREVDPQARISVSGTQTANAYDGFDWVKLSPYFDAMNGYGYGEQERTRLSFHNGPMKNATPAGYGNKGQGVQYQLWEQLTNHGCGHVLFWWVSFRNPDLTFCKSADDYARGFAEIKSGIGRQYQLAQRKSSPIAVLYSMNAMRAASAQGKFGIWTKELEGFTAQIVAEGFDPIFVSEEQIAAGELEKRGIKAVFLPLPTSLGLGLKKGGIATLPALQKFAAAGGIVAANSVPQQDEFLQKTTLDEDAWAKVVEKTQGKNVADALSASGAKPWVTVRKADGSAVPGLSIAVHTLGENRGYLVTLLRRPIGQKQVVGADGVVTYQPDTSGGNQIEDAVVDVTALGNVAVNPLRRGQADVPQIKDGKFAYKLPAGDAVAFSLLPYKVTKLNLTTKAEGRNAVIDWKIQSDKGPLARHAVRVDVSENGKPDLALSCNATSNEDGTGTLTIPLAQEDKGRKLTITLRDVLTGTEEKTELSVP